MHRHRIIATASIKSAGVFSKFFGPFHRWSAHGQQAKWWHNRSLEFSREKFVRKTRAILFSLRIHNILYVILCAEINIVRIYFVVACTKCRAYIRENQPDTKWKTKKPIVPMCGVQQHRHTVWLRVIIRIIRYDLSEQKTTIDRSKLHENHQFFFFFQKVARRKFLLKKLYRYFNVIVFFSYPLQCVSGANRESACTSRPPCSRQTAVPSQRKLPQLHPNDVEWAARE